MTLTSVFLGIKYTVPIFRRQGGGVIVNTASISGIRADYGMGAYNAAKAGVINLTRNAALENAPHQIRINCVCPSGINTRVSWWWARIIALPQLELSMTVLESRF